LTGWELSGANSFTSILFPRDFTQDYEVENFFAQLRGPLRVNDNATAVEIGARRLLEPHL
jgi:hypothetical protein